LGSWDAAHLGRIAQRMQALDDFLYYFTNFYMKIETTITRFHAVNNREHD
jgi:hypothetical protein